jgi:hypothetical protein
MERAELLAWITDLLNDRDTDDGTHMECVTDDDTLILHLWSEDSDDPQIVALELVE